MKSTSIRTKVLVALSICLLVGVAGTMALMRYSFEHNARTLAMESVNEAEKLFGILSAREVSKMMAVETALATNPELQKEFAARDREGLLGFCTPLCGTLKSEGITNWVFHTPEPEPVAFLRVHNPTKYGDHLDRFLIKEAARTHLEVTGNELAKSGFAVRVVRPMRDQQGQVIGYMEFGEELGQFIHTMKSQTGDNYGLLLNKKFVDRKLWADSSAAWNRRDNWDDHAGYVVADKTGDSERIIELDGDLSNIPETGKVLERFREGDAMYVRGMFPIRDAAGNTVGAMFVVRNISAFYWSMRQTQTVLIVLTVLALAVSTLLVLAILRKLVFQRLDGIIAVATRVVGGDYETEIRTSSDDEIGQFEKLFEQFRRVFVDALSNVPELQEKR